VSDALFDSKRRGALFVLAVVVACCSRSDVGGASPTTAPGPSVPGPSPSPTLVPLTGACTTAESTTRVVLEHLFALTTTGDARQVADCYARAYRDAHPTFAAGADAWTHAGPATVESVRLVDRVNECDRFEVVAELAHGEALGWQGRQRVFYSLGLELGVPRVFDSGSALAAPEVTRVACR
jgi:hypothetical protein